MGNQSQVVLICRETWWGEMEYKVSELPSDGKVYTDIYQREVGLPGATRRFENGQAVYVNGLRIVKN